MIKVLFKEIREKDAAIMGQETMVAVAVYHIVLFNIKVGEKEVLIKK